MVKREIKHEMMRGLPKERLTLIISHPNNEHLLDWEHSREFEYQKQMYDVVYQEIKGDSIFYWCWADHKESALNRELSTLFHQSMSQTDDTESKEGILLSLFKPFFLSKQPLHNGQQPYLTLCTTTFFYSSTLVSIDQSVESPPPQA
jgi:hypothetical protein